jgi:SIR2-like domain
MDARRLTLFLGAGASLAGESGLPLFGHLRTGFLRAAELEPELEEFRDLRNALDGLLGFLAPEALLQRLDVGRVPVRSLMVEAFNRQEAAPNLVHSTVAWLLQHGATVWTTNYDTLVEEACAVTGVECLAWARAQGPPPMGANLLKVHGTLPSRAGTPPRWGEPDKEALVFSSGQVLVSLPEPWARRLRADLEGRDVLVLGYRGADVDLYPLLLESLPKARTVRWFDTGAVEREILERFPFLERVSGDEASAHGGREEDAGSSLLVVSQNPTETFAEAVSGLHPELGAIVAGRPVGVRWPDMALAPLDLSLSNKAELLAELGLQQPARRLYRRVLWARWRRAGPRDRARAVRILLRGRAGRLRRNPVARLLLRALAGPLTPGRLARPARRIAAEDPRSSERWPSTETVERWLAQAGGQDATLALGLVRRYWYEGRLAEAEALARESRRRALPSKDGEPVNPAHAAGFSFQLADILAMRGHFREALALNLSGIAGVASTSLALWQGYSKEACKISMRRFDDADLDLLQGDIRRFLEVIEEPLATPWVDLVVAVAEKIRGRPQAALDVLAGVRSEAAEAGSSLLLARASLHIADARRVLGDSDAAMVALQDVRDSPLHEAVGTLLRVVIDPAGHAGLLAPRTGASSPAGAIGAPQ